MSITMPEKPASHRDSSPAPSRRRSGVITLWTILFLPVLLLLFIIVVEVIHLWLARVELENALEASALAAVKAWAESGTTPAQDWTLPGRTVGLEYAAANTISGVPLDGVFGFMDNLGTYDNDGLLLPDNPNENAYCLIDGIAPEGNLIFGAIIDDDDDGDLEFTTAEIPSCGATDGDVMIDLSDKNPDKQNAWGVSFRVTDDNAGLLITRIEIDLSTTTPAKPVVFDGPPILASGTVEPKIYYSAGVHASQSDNYGFYGWTTDPTLSSSASPTNSLWGVWPGDPPVSSPPDTTNQSPQIEFTLSPDDRVLTIDFYSYGGDAGFSPGDRFRFGIGLTENSYDGDDLAGATVTIHYSDTTSTTGTFFDDLHDHDCIYDSTTDLYTDTLGIEHMVVHPGTDHSPEELLDLPCPPIDNGGGGNDQSYAMSSSSGQRNYAVRAQATIEVPGLLCQLCNLDIGPFSVSACATAMYDCEFQRPRLIRPESYTCSGATP